MKALPSAAFLLAPMALGVFSSGQRTTLETPLTRERYFLYLGDQFVGEVRVRALALSAVPADPRRQSYVSIESEPTPSFAGRVLRPAFDSKGVAKLSGKIVYVDTGSRQSGVLTFKNARVVTVRVPSLDKESMEPCLVRVSFVPESSSYAKGNRAKVVEPPLPAKTWTVSNFKVQMGNFPPEQILRTGSIEARFAEKITFRPFAVEARQNGNGNEPPTPMPARAQVTLQLQDGSAQPALTLSLGECRIQNAPSSLNVRAVIVTPPP